MSSAETLNFGPEWLRALSGGSNVTSPPPSPATTPCAVKFKLAEFRYGREEMLALYTEESEVPSTLLDAPSVVSEKALMPLTLMPLPPDDQKNFSAGINSEVHYKPRIPAARGRSTVPRGRGRGRGEGYSRSLSQNDDAISSFSRLGPKDYSRRESWDEKAITRNGRTGEEPFGRKPFRRSDASGDWRSDAIRGSGDGVEVDNPDPSTDWRPPGPVRKSSWKGRSNVNNWRAPSNGTGMGGKNRSFENKFEEEPARIPEWAEGTDESEVGVFDSSGAFKSKETNAPRAQDKETSAEPVKESVFESKSASQEEDEVTAKESAAEAVQSEEQASSKREEEAGNDDLRHIEQAALQLVDSLSEGEDWNNSGGNRGATEDVGQQEVNKLPADDLADGWFYKDPQGEIQGPFTSQEMREWFMAGYFTRDLMIRGARDHRFLPLGEVMKTTQGDLFGLGSYLKPRIAPTSYVKNIHSNEVGFLSMDMQQQQQQQRGWMMGSQHTLFNCHNAHYDALLPQIHPDPIQLPVTLSVQPDPPASLTSPPQPAQIPQPVNEAPISSHVGHPTTVSASAWAVPLQSHHPHHQATRLPVQHSLSTPLPLQPQVPPDNTAPSSQVPPANTAPSPQIPPVHALPSPQEPPVHATPSPRIPPIHALPSPQEPPAPSLQDPPVHAIPSPQVPPVHALPSTEAVTETFDTSTKAIGPRTVNKEKRAQEQKEKRTEELKEQKVGKLALEPESQKQDQLTSSAVEKKSKKNGPKSLEVEAAKQPDGYQVTSKHKPSKRQAKASAKEQKKERERERAEKKQTREKSEKKQNQSRKLEEEAKKQREEEQAQEEALKKQMMIQAQKEELNKKKQQEQLKNIKLPSNANWAQLQQPPTPAASSVLEIQKMQEEKERVEREQEHMLAIHQHRQMQERQRTVWGATPMTHTQATPHHSNTLSLAQIQEEETRKQQQQSVMKQTQVPPKPAPASANLAWGGFQPKPVSTGSIWDVLGDRPTNHQSNARGDAFPAIPSRNEKPEKRGGGGSGHPDPSSLLSLFQQQQTVDPLVSWCEEQLKSFSAARNLDIPTFVAFLCDVESPYDVKDYITSYLGESRSVQNFADAFLRQRTVTRHQKSPPQTRTCTAAAPRKPATASNARPEHATGNTGPEFVTGNTKRGKRKQRKLQKVDPSILGFSVNAASDRFNSGEIELPDNR